ncbi:unnamed protein product [Linum trigynum]|uniref:Uncharacterized protein n=1 Tax=Linum trigynum TaxID=586398 RepID=A0AAV2FVT4_9ROSI
MTSGQSTVRLTRSLAKSMELENYVSPAKKTRMQDVTPPPTPDLKVIVLDAEPGLDHDELGVQNKPLTPPQKLSMKVCNPSDVHMLPFRPLFSLFSFVPFSAT